MKDPALLHAAAERAEYFTAENCHILELSNSAADEALSVARARVEPGQTTRWHRLRETVERYLILSGEGRVEVEGLQAQDVQPGDVVLIPAGHAQRIHNNGEEDLVFLALCTPRFKPANYEDCDGAASSSPPVPPAG